MENDIALVTGASRGIGQATALALARRGTYVIATGRDEQALHRTRTLVADSGGRCEVHTLDVTDFSAVHERVETIIRDLGHIDILINNAGRVVHSPLSEYSVAAFDDMMAVNCHGMFYGCRAVWPHMANRHGGTIVNISSMSAKDPFPGLSAYGASKRWVNALTEALATEGRPQGIRVYAVAPGAVETDMLRSAFPDYPGEQCLKPKDVADSVIWLLDPLSQYATGSIIYLSTAA